MMLSNKKKKTQLLEKGIVLHIRLLTLKRTHTHVRKKQIYIYEKDPCTYTKKRQIKAYLLEKEGVAVYVLLWRMYYFRDEKHLYIREKICENPPPFLDGYCSTVQDLLDWFKVDLGFTELYLFR